MNCIPMMYIIICFFSCFFSYQSQAESWVNVTSTKPSTPLGFYDFTYNYSWPYEESDAIVPKCQTGCMIAAFYEGGDIYEGGGGIVITSEDNCYTMRCLHQKWSENKPLIGSAVQYSSQPGARESCWTFLAFDFTGVYPATNGIRLQGSNCGIAPPPNVECDISEPIILDHGVIQNNELFGSVVSKNILMVCTGGVTAKLNLGAGDKIDMNTNGGILYSDVYVNDVKLTSSSNVSVDIRTGNVELNVKSVLFGSGVINGGEYNGSGVIVMTII